MGLFSKKSIGLDVSDNTIELVELKKTRSKISFSKYNRVFLNPGVVVNGEIKDEKKLEENFNKLFSEAKPKKIKLKKVNFALPENQVFTHFFKVKYKRESEIKSLVYKEAFLSIPIRKDKIWLEYRVLRKEKNKNEDKIAHIFLVVTDKKICESWQNFFKRIKIEIESFDLADLALYRAFKQGEKKNNLALVDIGSRQTSLFLFKNNILNYSCSINIAGEDFTKIISQSEKIDEKKAEEKKIKEGVRMKNKKTSQALEKKIKKLIKEIKETLDYSRERYKINIDKIILTGESSKMKGFIDLIKKEIKTKIELGKIVLSDKNIPLEYSGAVGLAMGGLNTKYGKDLKISLVGNKKNKIDFEDILERKENEQESFKTKKNILLLLIILILGAFSIFGTYFIREKRYSNNIPIHNIEEYKNIHEFNIKIPLAVNDNEYTNDRVRARLIQVDVNNLGRDEEIRKKEAVNLASNQKGAGESLWSAPVKTESLASSSRSVYYFIVYNEEELNKVIKDKIELEGFSNNYIFNNVKKEEIKITKNPNIYELIIKINISTKAY